MAEAPGDTTWLWVRFSGPFILSFSLPKNYTFTSTQKVAFFLLSTCEKHGIGVIGMHLFNIRSGSSFRGILDYSLIIAFLAQRQVSTVNTDSLVTATTV